ncbi:hypothetical protein D9756_002073 [Leucocoprinus leucothites]|uniref:F-box domain-containing protein n=1 Tax=Leucocoprinus leucothites TaxID=201217 RepID=A0A8H5GBU3_9AGAR|nr:hypothetical protein D9756_002073 [Leucoagaricus leucothites]
MTMTSRGEEIARIFEQIQSLDSVALHIADLKRAAHRQLNDLRPPTSHLPFEVLSHIFQFACPPIDFNARPLCEYDYYDLSAGSGCNTIAYPESADYTHLQYRCFPLILGAVCSRWRKVAWSTPELWTTFALEVSETKFNSQVSLLRLYLTNSGSLPTSLEVNAWRRWRQYLSYTVNSISLTSVALEMGLAPLANLLFNEFSTKIEALRLAGTPPVWLGYILQGKVPQLRDLRFHCSHMTEDTINFLQEGGALSFQSSFPSITILHLQNIHLDLCIKILCYIPCLVEFHCYWSAIDLWSPEPLSGWDSAIPFREPFSLPSLKSFGWTVFDGVAANNNLLLNIRLPSLKEVQWTWDSDVGETWNEDSAAVLAFFSSLPETVHSLSYYDQDTEFWAGSEEYDFYLGTLSTIPHIRSLTLKKCSKLFIKCLFSLLSTDVVDTQPKCLLPSLERIVICKYDDGEEGIIQDFVEMLKARLSVSQVRRFRFEAVDCNLVWSQSTWGGLMGLAHDFNLVVQENSEEMEYGYFTDRELKLFTYFDGSDASTDEWGWPHPSKLAAVDFPYVYSNSGWGKCDGGGWGDWGSPSSWNAWGCQGTPGIGLGSSVPTDDLNFERDFGQWFAINGPGNPLPADEYL